MKLFNVTLEMSSTRFSNKSTYRESVLADSEMQAVAVLTAKMLKDFWASEENVADFQSKNLVATSIEVPVFRLCAVEQIEGVKLVNGW